MAERRALAERALSLLQDALRESESGSGSFDAELNRERPSGDSLEAAETDALLWQREVGHLEEALENERALVQRLKKKLALAESGPEAFTSREVNYWRERAERFDEETREYKRRIAELHRELQARSRNGLGQGGEGAWYDDAPYRQNGENGFSGPELSRPTAELEERIRHLEDSLSTAVLERDTLAANLERVQNGLEQTAHNREQQREHEEIERLKAHKSRLENEVSELVSRADEAERGRDESIAKIGELERAVEDASEQINGLESELKEEKECTEKLSELANERRETIGKLEGDLEEAQERYEEAKWRLDKTEYLQRLLARRTKLILSLIEAIRAKTTANSALKAGMDSLRKFKGVSESRQRQLASQVDVLSNQVEALKKKLLEQRAAPQLRSDQSHEQNAKLADLQERLDTQAELIASLEDELKQAKAARQVNENRESEMTALREQLESKQAMIEQLEADVDEQQRKLSKLRGSESETQRLKILSDKDRNLIKSLERENAQLREALTQKEKDDGTAGEGSASDLIAKLKERDSSIAQLMGTVKEQETTIAELSESVEQWKKKYEFVSAAPLPAYEAMDPS